MQQTTAARTYRAIPLAAADAVKRRTDDLVRLLRAVHDNDEDWHSKRTAFENACTQRTRLGFELAAAEQSLAQAQRALV
jgi:hypothetical protein